MVVSSDLYTHTTSSSGPFHLPAISMNHDNDGPQSSEEGSGMHSPVLYGAAAQVGGVDGCDYWSFFVWV